jgi:hypothetical protein
MAVMRATAAILRRPFTAVSVLDAPNHPGIDIFRGPVSAPIGKSSNLQADLEAHPRGDGGTRTDSASHFRFEELHFSQVDGWHAALLARYRGSHMSNMPFENRMDATHDRDASLPGATMRHEMWDVAPNAMWVRNGAPMSASDSVSSTLDGQT